MEFSVLQSVVTELAEGFTSARIDKVFQTPDRCIILQLHGRSGRGLLGLWPDPPFSRMHLVSRKPAGTDALPAFIQLLRKHLINGRLDRIVLLNDDRIVELRFSLLTGACRLMFELTGSSSNLILTDDELVILSALRPSPAEGNNVRPLISGLRYRLPERKRHDAPGSAPDGEPFGGPVGDGSAFPRNAAAEQWYEAAIRDRSAKDLKRALTGTVQRACAKIERRLRAIEGDRAEAARADEWKLWGDLLLTRGASIPGGSAAAEVEDFDGGQTVIPLDPALSVVKNADRLYRKYKKAKAGAAVTAERIARTKDELQRLTELLQVIDGAETFEDLEALRGRVEEFIAPQRGRSGSGASQEQVGLPYRRILREGWEILIGKSASGNDYLSTRLAKPDDLWLHAEGLPGSHVLVRNPRRNEVPPGIVQEAASLAAYFSKGRGATSVPVAYTAARHVRKPRGAKPGSVILTERRTIMVRPNGP